MGLSLTVHREESKGKQTPADRFQGGVEDRYFECVLLLAVWLVCIYSLLAGPLSILTLSSNAILLMAAFLPARLLGFERGPFLPVVGFAAGLLFFQALALLGITEWPYRSASSPGAYSFLMLNHVVLALCIYGSVTAFSGWRPVRESLRLGRFYPYRFAVGATVLPVFLFAGLVMGRNTGGLAGPWFAFLPAAAVKAMLTGVGEEAFYRGLLQKAAIPRFGVVAGILFQAGCYAGFHLPLTQGFGPHGLFLLGMLALGLVFGTMTHLTKGIGWAAAIHVGLDLILEWRNIS